MLDAFDWTALDRYFSGESPPNEAAAIERWVAADPARAREIVAARAIWTEVGVVRPRFDTQAAKAKLHAKMARPIRSTTLPASPTPRRSAVPLPASGGRAWRPWAIAAGLVAVLAGTALWRTVGPARSMVASTVAGHEYATLRGQRRELRLSDGTRVMLGPESRLTIASTYGATARDVRLEGQGYFDVVHDERRPFSVRVGGTVVRDLGTEFDVRAYATDRDIRVAVAAGRVALETQVLVPGQVGERAPDGRVTVRTAVDLNRYLAWMDGRLVFEDTPLAEALLELERWSDLDFQLVDSSLARLPLSGALEARPSAETLDLLASLPDVRLVRHGNTIILDRASVVRSPAR